MKFLTSQIVEEIHSDLARELKIYSVLRDEAHLLSALARPMHLKQYTNADVFGCAASYLVGLIQNMAFSSCNTQTAYISAITFLNLNGWMLDVPQESVAVFVLAVAAGDIDEIGAALFFKDFCIALEAL